MGFVNDSCFFYFQLAQKHMSYNRINAYPKYEFIRVCCLRKNL